MVDLLSLLHKSNRSYTVRCVICSQNISDSINVLTGSRVPENTSELTQVMEMTPPSPVSPTSPLSPLSPTSPSLPATPTASCLSRKQLWETSAKCSFHSLGLDEATTSYIRGPSSRRSRSVVPSVVKGSFAERRSQTSNFEGSSGVQDSERHYKMTLSEDEYINLDASLYDTDDETITETQSYDVTMTEVQDGDAASRYESRVYENIASGSYTMNSADLMGHGHVEYYTFPENENEDEGILEGRTARRSRSPVSSHRGILGSSRSSSRSLSQPRSIIRTHTQTHIRFHHSINGPITYPRTPKFRPIRPAHTFPSKIRVAKPEIIQLEATISHLGIALLPLVSVTTGLAHPEFPCSLLQYNLLTHEQLDSLARWYHQTIDAGHERWMYPTSILKPWIMSNTAVGTCPREGEAEIDLSAKRRWFGRFIGLRGCESPTSQEHDDQEDLAQRMEREWKAAMKRAEEEAKLQEKVWRGAW